MRWRRERRCGHDRDKPWFVAIGEPHGFSGACVKWEIESCEPIQIIRQSHDLLDVMNFERQLVARLRRVRSCSVAQQGAHQVSLYWRQPSRRPRSLDDVFLRRADVKIQRCQALGRIQARIHTLGIFQRITFSQHGLVHTCSLVFASGFYQNPALRQHCEAFILPAVRGIQRLRIGVMRSGKVVADKLARLSLLLVLRKFG